ncbi:hypothetical protein APX81_06715 [Escherichia coli]|nr:hypothetical protein [Escherichia coli]EEW6031791.1 hypothetical protein [Escherichia coli]EFN9261319.1 hypothetical protein [Escherichia coli]MXF13764.1 hypothetical protein [Escherichia coli]PAZ23291.1 hypothetical protein APU33_23615 [Escherichia coli]
MSRAAYARQHGINNTFWYLCRTLSADDSRGPAQADDRPVILPVSFTDSVTSPPGQNCRPDEPRHSGRRR